MSTIGLPQIHEDSLARSKIQHSYQGDIYQSIDLERKQIKLSEEPRTKLRYYKGALLWCFADT